MLLHLLVKGCGEYGLKSFSSLNNYDTSTPWNLGRLKANTEIFSLLPEICQVHSHGTCLLVVGRESWGQYSSAGILLMWKRHTRATPTLMCAHTLCHRYQMNAQPQKGLSPGCPSQTCHRHPQSSTSWASLCPGHFNHTNKNEAGNYQQCVKWVQSPVPVPHPVHL